MRVAVCLTTPRDVYSGGRYCALGLAEVAALAGHETWFISDNRPIFADDWTAAPAHASIQFCRTRDFRRSLPGGSFDVVVLVPGTGMPGFYDRVQALAIERGARLVILNFESGDWFNEVSPFPRPLEEWLPWQRAARYASLILSISREGNRWAQRFYEDDAPGARYGFAYPPVNTYAADAVPGAEREDRVVLFMRFSASAHKGSTHLLRLIDDAMRGFTLVLILGKDDPPADVVDTLREVADRHGVRLEFRQKLSDREKFEEIKRARLVLFPSLFEGFGYPPVEALYCGTPCVAFDLPVLRETCGDALVYAAHNDWEAFRGKIGEALRRTWNADELRAAIRGVTDHRRLAEDLTATLTSAMDAPVPGDADARAKYAQKLRKRDRLMLNDWRVRIRSARRGVGRFLRGGRS